MAQGTTRLFISGCCGRMGQRIASLALGDPAYVIAGGLEGPGHQALGQDLGAVLGTKPLGVVIADDVQRALSAGDVLIEFTRPEPTLEHVRIARRLKKPMVIGTTGLSDDQRRAVADAAKDIPIVLSPNMSPGVNVLFELVATAAKRLGLRYDVEVVEAHHRTKQDAPSGTAKRLVEVLAEARRQPASQIPAHAIRAGEIVGDHTVIFAGPFERLELTHRAQSRDVFALGALRAAHAVRTKPPGLYDMGHVLQDEGDHGRR